jgi:two-component sensor histidine kinase/AmiR/NasT family two-component response regulator
MQKSKILVVEDDKIISMEIKDRLQTLGYEVPAVVFSGEEAIEKARIILPDLVLMDIRLQGKIDGIEAAENIKAECDIPVIYLTAYTDEATLQRAKVTEPYGYIVKPLEERELHSAIEISLYKHRAEKKIKESEVRYRAIVESFDGYIYINTADYVLKFLNNHMMDYVKHDATGELCYKAIYGRESVCPWCVSDVVLKGKTVRSERLNARDGRWFYEVSTPINHADGFVSKQSMIQDITERKEAEEKLLGSLKEKEVMLSEIHHRVKNNLQIIASLLRLQSASIADPKALNSFKVSQDRVNSMALIHEKLYRSKSLSKIDFEDYLNKLAIHLFQVYGVSKERVQLHISAKDIWLGIDTAIPCGLIINELISNSLKHAFPGNRSGNIDIALSMNGGNTYSLVIKDDGMGLPPGLDYNHTESLGLQLVNTLTKQLAGNIEVERQGGTEIKIKFEESSYKNRVEKN